MGTVLQEPLPRFIMQATAIVGLSRLLGLGARIFVPAGTSARARTSFTANVKPRGGTSKDASTFDTWSSFSGRSVTVIALSFCVSVIDADSERCGRMSSIASSTRLCFST